VIAAFGGYHDTQAEADEAAAALQTTSALTPAELDAEQALKGDVKQAEMKRV
jgi:hypothetical protein